MKRQITDSISEDLTDSDLESELTTFLKYHMPLKDFLISFNNFGGVRQTEKERPFLFRNPQSYRIQLLIERNKKTPD